jgi:hypothetical protein
VADGRYLPEFWAFDPPAQGTVTLAAIVEPLGVSPRGEQVLPVSRQVKHHHLHGLHRVDPTQANSSQNEICGKHRLPNRGARHQTARSAAMIVDRDRTSPPLGTQRIAVIV